MISRSSHFFLSYIGFTRLSLIWENLWPALWPATAIAGLFIAAALLNVFALLPLWIHVLILIATLAGFTSVIYRVFIHFPKIEAEQARHRLELDSGLIHRPLASLDDALAMGINDTQSQELWRIHQARMSTQSENLKLKLPKAGLSRRDPLGLRAAVSLILLIGILAAGADSFSRIGQALSPPLDTPTLASPAELTIWIMPPAYTRNPPVVLRKGGTKKTSPSQGTPETTTTQSALDPVRVPMGSEVLAQMTGGSDVPILTHRGQDFGNSVDHAPLVWLVAHLPVGAIPAKQPHLLDVPLHRLLLSQLRSSALVLGLHGALTCRQHLLMHGHLLSLTLLQVRLMRLAQGSSDWVVVSKLR